MNEINSQIPDIHIDAFVFKSTDVLMTRDKMFGMFLGTKKTFLRNQEEIHVIRKESWYKKEMARTSGSPPIASEQEFL